MSFDKTDWMGTVCMLAGYALGWIHSKWGPVSNILARIWLSTWCKFGGNI